MSTGSYDVAIVGAGPAGCTAAKVATQHGLKTIVFDGRKQIGKPVQCGEFLPIPEELKNIFPNSARIVRLANVPQNFITNRTSLLMLSSPSNHQFEFSLRVSPKPSIHRRNWHTHSNRTRYFSNDMSPVFCIIHTCYALRTRTSWNKSDRTVNCCRNKNCPQESQLCEMDFCGWILVLYNYHNHTNHYANA